MEIAISVNEMDRDPAVYQTEIAIIVHRMDCELAAYNMAIHIITHILDGDRLVYKLDIPNIVYNTDRDLVVHTATLMRAPPACTMWVATSRSTGLRLPSCWMLYHQSCSYTRLRFLRFY